MEKKYKWEDPHEWFLDWVKREDDVANLHSIIEDLVYRLDGDAIQDIFKLDMKQSGYYKELKEEEEEIEEE